MSNLERPTDAEISSQTPKTPLSSKRLVYDGTTPGEKKRPRNESSSLYKDSFANVCRPKTSTTDVTPIINRLRPVDSQTNKHNNIKWLMEERKNEVDNAYENQMKEHSGIVNMLVPKCDSKRAEAERVASLVISQLERVINGADDLQETASVESPHDLFTDDLANSNSNNNSSSAGDTSFLKLIQKSISNNNSQPAQKFRREPEMYPVIASLFRFTEDLITKFAHTQDSTDKSPSQSVKVYSKTDVSPKDSDNYLRIDLGLFLNDMWERPAFDDSFVREDKDFEIGAIDPRYADIFAVIEAKVSENDQAHAYKQLLLYTYNIYWRQHDRRFAWGLTVCDSIVRACVIGNDGALASERMDLTEIDGRSTFVQLLVNMSYCGREQLGFDPTIRHNRAKSLWEIDVYNDSDNSKTTCEIVSVMQAADRLFGRHTRCFKCKLADDSLNLGHFIVKDAWAYAECDSDMADLRDEVSILRDINEQLGADASLEGTIPKLHWGGVVKITAQDGFTADDISDPLFKILDGEDSTKHHRVHKRLAMGPIGEPLRKAKSVDELIIAVADAMEAHNTILERCGILHRDISTNNILINRSQGRIRGMLIDYDCAVRINADKTVTRPEMTGTLPFISMNNLDISLGNKIDYIPAARSGLDDWESLIYVLCWLGTFGINTVDETQRAKDLKAQIQEEKNDGTDLKKQRLGQEKQKRLKPYDELSIKGWRQGSTKDIVFVKSTQMESTSKFQLFIVQEFYKGEYKSLQALVHELRKTLFDNDRYSPDCKGTFIDTTHDPPINPFQARVEYASNIMTDLLAVVRNHRAKAIERMNNDKN